VAMTAPDNVFEEALTEIAEFAERRASGAPPAR